MSVLTEAPVEELIGREHTTHSEQETRELARLFARLLERGDVVALRGELGTGKTVIVKAIAKALGYDGPVTSPSFTLLNVYDTPNFPIYHFDFYRIQSEAEAIGIGADEYIMGEGISLIEWPEKIQNLLPPQYYDIHLVIPDYANQPHQRKIRISKIRR